MANRNLNPVQSLRYEMTLLAGKWTLQGGTNPSSSAGGHGFAALSQSAAGVYDLRTSNAWNGVTCGPIFQFTPGPGTAYRTYDAVSSASFYTSSLGPEGQRGYHQFTFVIMNQSGSNQVPAAPDSGSIDAFVIMSNSSVPPKRGSR